MTLDAEINVGGSVFNYKFLGNGLSKKFLTKNGIGNHHNHCALYQESTEEQSSKMLKNHNDIKTIFTNLLKKLAPSQLVQDKTSKISRNNEYLEVDESKILIVNENKTSK